MSRGVSTLILFVVLVALGAYIWFVERNREPADPDAKPKVFAALEAEKIEELVVRNSKGETTIVKKQGDAWRLVSPVETEADAGEVSGITSGIARLEQQNTVDQPAALKEYGLEPARFEVGFKVTGEAQPRKLLLGDKTPTGADLYAKLADTGTVFLIQSYLESTFDRGTFDLRDKGALKFAREKVDGIEIARAGETVGFTKAADEWRITKPLAVRADFGAVEGLVGRLNTLQMKAITAPDLGDAKAYGLDAPQFTVTLSAGSARSMLLVGTASPDGSLYAKDGARPMVFTVDGTLADDLKKAAAEFRPKDLFEFRTFTGTRFEATRDGATTVFEKQKGTGEGATEKWVLSQPKKDVEESKILDALSAVSNLRAASFVDAVPAGAAQVAQFKGVSGDGKKEDLVTVAKAGEDYFASRAGDPGAAKLTADELEGALKALDALK
jgi:hypothetical protein